MVKAKDKANEEEVEGADKEPDNVYYYTDKATSIIYEVKFFQDFVLLRPATPELYDKLSKVRLHEFLANFEECHSNPEQIKNYLWGDDEVLEVN